MNLKNFESNTTSQFGEDGVISEIFKRLGSQHTFCVEFGVWDGLHYSNTWNLWHNQGWEALLIENDATKVEKLKHNTENFSKVHTLLATVTSQDEYSLDVLFKKYNFPKDVDFVSIDIDGDDYYIFESLHVFRPRVIAIEYNPTVPAHLEVVQEPGEYFGASARAMLRLAHEKKYKLAHMTVTNMFFVVEEEFEKLGFAEPALEEIFKGELLVYAFTSFDGAVFLSKNFSYGLSDRSRVNLYKNNLKRFLKGKKIGLRHPRIITQAPIMPVIITTQSK